ncbi:MAG: restriction endonuclease subunit S [Candidatus Gribaldobacteria bacterium]|nr:restriction endonuclease subunit S [Candidatus Gribaldobacteria bacterium]
MQTFQKIKIKDFCEITSSKRIFADEYLSSGVPFYRGKEISEKQRSSSEVSDSIYISREKFEEIKSKYGAPQKGDLLLTSVGTIGNPYLVKENEEFYFKDGNLTWFRNFRGINGQWLYYWLLSPQGKSELNKCTIGSSQKAYTINLLYALQIELPDIPTQTRIASVLSAYDDLIENNEKRIKALGEMAQLLYTEWFVKFKFPGHEKSKLIDSHTEYGPIPEGWEVKRLKEIGKAVTGKTPPTGNLENFDGEILFIKTPDIHGNIFVLKTEQTLSKIGVKTQSLKLLPEKTVFVSCIGTLGVVGITSKPSQTNQQINALMFNDNSDYCFFYFFAKSLKQKLIGLGSNGSTMGNVNKDKFENINILYPNKKTRKLFYKATTNLFDEILTLQKYNQNLSQTRDLLIPQLVTGKRELK